MIPSFQNIGIVSPFYMIFLPFISIWALCLTRLHINNHLWRIYSGFVPDAPDTARAIAMPARLTAATKR